ncbi:hypothetical protein B0T25DRAFT_555702 [Lasiosphaeria hispida]|uniref:Secreted protein n=1 Tax=Lasiosphaeria hispida TaxID=260671 RepID=A0AAJ0H8W2_9PEZI|nr:hypothetical protein B0T25DRAFT_555702 [Lasiosphaeria hispida]
MWVSSICLCLWFAVELETPHNTVVNSSSVTFPQKNKTVYFPSHCMSSFAWLCAPTRRHDFDVKLQSKHPPYSMTQPSLCHGLITRGEVEGALCQHVQFSVG